MKTLLIRRITTGKQGTYGGMVFENEAFAVTLELDWLNNKPSVSCIPAGEYICKRVNSPKFGDTFEVTDVPGRTHILFHKANLTSDLLGCIGIGEEFGKFGNKTGIKRSKSGYNEFMAILSDDNEFRLVIVNDWKTNLLGD